MVQDSTLSSVEPKEPGGAEDQEIKDRGKIAIKISSGEE
jgi:hypothetical protein